MDSLIASEALFHHVDSQYLDCVTDNLALLLLHKGHQEVRDLFASQWHFAFEPLQSEPLPRLSLQPPLEMIEAQTKWKVHQETLHKTNYLDVIQFAIERAQPALVLGDAFFMPWQPYFGHEHLEHSFLIDGISPDRRFIHIVDAHENQTEWGKAQPVATELPSLALQVILDLEHESEQQKTCIMLEPTDRDPKTCVRDILLTNSRQIRTAYDQRQFHTFAQYYHRLMPDVKGAKALELALWLIGRSRALHSLWLRDLAANSPELLPAGYPELYEHQVVSPWKRAGEQSYLMLRRIVRGRPFPETCFSLIEDAIAPQEAALGDALLDHLENQV